MRRRIVRLPTRHSGRRAARGTDGRIQPWGNEWDAAKCNTAELGLAARRRWGCSRRVQSIWCLDMAGNVFVWTGSLWGKVWSEPDFKYRIILRMGREIWKRGLTSAGFARRSFYYDRAGVRCAYRGRSFPNDSLDCEGFV